MLGRGVTFVRGGMGVGAVGVALSAASLPAAAGCTTHLCDASTVELGATAPYGSVITMADGLVEWETAPLGNPDGSADPPVTWLDLPGERTYLIHYPVTFAEVPEPQCDLAADRFSPDTNLVGCGTQIQFSNPTTTGVTLLNPTCQEFGLRVYAVGTLAGSP